MGCFNRFSAYVIKYNTEYKCKNKNIRNGSNNKGNITTTGMMSTLNIINSSITTNNKTGNDKNINIMAYMLITLVAIACYLNGIHGDFVHDDIPAIILNRDVTGANKLSKSFLNDFWGTPMDDANSHKSYRPLTTITFRLNHYFFGYKAVWFHLTNILMHAIVCILFTRVCFIVAGLRSNFAIAAGLLFAVHPIHTEAVTGIVGRADILACIFFLISLLIYHGDVFRSDDTSTVLSIIFGGISMLSKETGITVLIVNLSYDLYRTWPSLKRAMIEVHWTPESQHCYRRLFKLLVSMGILLTIRLALLQGSFPKFSQQDNPTAYHPNFRVRMLTFCYLAAFNWWLLLCPVNLSHDWQMGSIPLLTSFSDPRNLLTLWAFSSTLLMLYKSILDFENQRYAPLTLGILLLILPFLPATNFFVTVGFVVAERVLYIPSLGCILLVAYGAQILWESMNKYRNCIILMGVFLITVGSCKTIARNRDWCSREYLLRAGLRVLPHNAKMHYNFGNFLKDSFQHDMAKKHYREALRLWPTYASAYNNLGTLVNNFEVAERHFLSAIMYASSHVNAHFNLAQLYIKRNRSYDAVRMLTRCIQLDGSHIKAHIELIKLHPGIDARNIFQNAIQMNPNREELRLFFGRWLYGRGFATAALNMFQWVLRKNESNTIAIRGACQCFRKMGQFSRLHSLITRIQTDHHTATKIYMRNWNIRVELRRRAYMYDIENESFHTPEIAKPSSLNKNLPSVMMRSKSNKRYFNGSQRKASVYSKVVERSRMIVSIQNMQSKKILYKFGKTNRTYNSINIKGVLNEKQYCPHKLINFPSELRKNLMESKSNETPVRIFYSKTINNVSNDCKGMNKSCEDCREKILKLNRNAITSNSSISDDFHSKLIYIKNKFKIKQNYKHTPPKLKSMNSYYSLL